MNETVVWFDGERCLLDDEVGTFSVTDPEIVARFRDWVSDAAVASKLQADGSFTATTMATIRETAKVQPHAGNAGASSCEYSTTVFGSPLPKKRVDELPQASFSDVLEARRSFREFNTPTYAQVHALLTHAARTRFVWNMDDEWKSTSRPYPSAGARHPIEVVVCARDVDGLETGLYWFDPWSCRLSILRNARIAAVNIAERTMAALGSDFPPPVVICLVAELSRTLSRYSGAMSLVLRDAGALMATICLVATAKDMAACPIGVGGASPLLQALEVVHPDWTEVGAIAVGRPVLPRQTALQDG